MEYGSFEHLLSLFEDCACFASFVFNQSLFIFFLITVCLCLSMAFSSFFLFLSHPVPPFLFLFLVSSILFFAHCLPLLSLFLSLNHLFGLVVKASTSRAEDRGFKSHLPQDFCRSSHTSDLKIGTQVGTLPGVVGSELGLVGQVSVYCDWVR